MRETRERRRLLTVRRSAIRKPGPACLLLAVCGWSPLGAQGQASEPERVALVVGNTNYEHLESISNPVNDATDIAEALERLDFDVTKLLNASYAEFSAALKSLAVQSEKAAMALVFYAGHGLRMDCRDYLVPVDAALAPAIAVRFETLSLDDVLASMTGAGLRMVILDASRTGMSTFGEGMHRAPCGLCGADVDLVDGDTLVAHATEPGTPGSDGSAGQRNSPYTAALLSQIGEPQELTEVFRAVRNQVLEVTNRAQQPNHCASLVAKHFLAGRPETELEFWWAIKDSGNPEDFVAYLRDYPKGRFAEMARLHVQELADAKADDDLRDTGLHWAVKEDLVEVARVLLDAGADASAADEDRYTPLHFVDKADIARMLLDAGADTSINADAKGGYSPLLELLVTEKVENKADIVALLLDAGADVSTWAHAGMTPLLIAVSDNEADIVRMLIDAGADVRHGGDFHQSALHFAVDEGVAADIVRMLLDSGADASVREDDGLTLLHLAVKANAPEVARVLLEAGAAVDAKDEYGLTPLHWAARNKAEEEARVLLEAGASRSEVPEDLRGRLPE